MEWSNSACLGYAIAAAEKMGMAKKDVQRLVNLMRSEFEFTSVDEAEKIYAESDY